MPDQPAPQRDVMPPLDALPINGVPIAATRHVILAVPPISSEAHMVFMLAACAAWALEPKLTIDDVKFIRRNSPDGDPAAYDRGLAELVDRGLATVEDAGRIHLTTGVPGSPPPPPEDEVWAAHQAWLDDQVGA